MTVAVACLDVAYYRAALRVASAVADSLLYMPSEFPPLPVSGGESPAMASGFDALAVVGPVPDAVGMLDRWKEGVSAAIPVIVVDCECRFVVPLREGAPGGVSVVRLASSVAGSIGAEVVVSRAGLARMWQLGTLSDAFGWKQSLQGDMEDMEAHFLSFGPTALLLEVTDRGSDYLRSTAPPHVDVFYDSADIPEGVYRLLIAVGPRIPDSFLAEMILSLIPPCVLASVGPIPDGETLEAAREADSGSSLFDSATYALLAERLLDEAVTTEADAMLPQIGIYSLAAAAPFPATRQKLLESGYYGRPLAHSILPDGRLLVASLLPRFVRQGSLAVMETPYLDPSLITLRGAELLRAADLLLYDPDTAPRRIRDWLKDGAEAVNIRGMEPADLHGLIDRYWFRGLLTVWIAAPSCNSLLQSGEPADNPALWLRSLSIPFTLIPPPRP